MTQDVRLLFVGTFIVATVSAGDYSTSTWESPVEKLEKHLSAWICQLTFQGKTIVINMLAISVMAPLSCVCCARVGCQAH